MRVVKFEQLMDEQDVTKPLDPEEDYRVEYFKLDNLWAAIGPQYTKYHGKLYHFDNKGAKVGLSNDKELQASLEDTKDMQKTADVPFVLWFDRNRA